MAPKQNMTITNLAENADIAIQFQQVAQSAYEQNKSMREQFEDTWKVADYMNKCAQNRTLNSTEKSQGANLADDSRANLGSTMFHRQVAQMASTGVSVELSRPAPWKYESIYSAGVHNSMEEGEAEANQQNSLTRYTMKHDRYKKKATDFWFALCKYGNLPLMIEWKFVVKAVPIVEPSYETLIDNETGEETVVQTGTNIVVKEMVVAAHPTQTNINISQLYADPYIGDLQDQTSVVVLSLVHKADILNDVNNGLYSQKMYDELNEDQIWDGTTGADFKKEMLANLNLGYDENSVSDIYLKWGIYHRIPVDGKNWDDKKSVPVWHLGVVIGNDISSGKLMTLIRNPDPDDQVPIIMVNMYPDDADLLYHVAPADVIRSNYSTECTLKEMAVDNMGLVNTPPLKVIDGMHMVKDFTFKKNALWHMYDQSAVEQMTVRDNTQSTIGLLEYIQQDQRMALSTDKNQLGESYGARTTATEAGYINSQTQQPNLVWISYVIDQKCEFMARKYLSFWKTYGSPQIIQQITDMPLIPDVYPVDFKGEFNIEINIVDEYKDDITSSNVIRDVIRMVAQSPQLLKSATHEVDIGELMKDVFFKSGLNGDKYIKTPQDGDAGRMAEFENIAMLQNGEQVEVHPDDNDVVHIRKHEGALLQWSGIEDQNPNIEDMKMHIQQHKLQEKTATQAQLQAEQQNAGSQEVSPDQGGMQ